VNNSSKVSLGLASAERKAVVLCAGWAICSLAVFVAIALLPGSSRIGELTVDLLKVGAFTIATVLCWRNAKDSTIVSGQIVWQAIATGLCFHALGDTTTLMWNLLWGTSTTASLSAIFYGASYLFLAIGLFNAVLPRQTNLTLAQSLGVATIGILGILLASWINFYMPTVEATTERQAITTGEPAVSLSTVGTSSKELPALVQAVETRLQPITRNMDLLYIAGDCILIVMAGALLIAFWGGAYSEAWKLIALAGACLYVADMLMIYHRSQGSYTHSGFWEIFWVLSALFFGLGASVELGVSTQMKQKRSRQQWI